MTDEIVMEARLPSWGFQDPIIPSISPVWDFPGVLGPWSALVGALVEPWSFIRIWLGRPLVGIWSDGRLVGPG